MSNFKCARCGFETKYKNVLQDHLRKRSECPSTYSDESRETLLGQLKPVTKYNETTFDCIYCERKFNSQGNRTRHYKVCKYNEDNIDVRTKLENLKKDVEQLKLQSGSNITNNTTNNNNTQNTQNNIIINVRDFGKENLSYLDFDFLTSCVEDMDLVKLIKDIHCNKEHPENHTVRVKNLRQKMMEKTENGKWIVEDTENTLSELIKLGYKVLNTHYRENKDEFSPIDMEEINEWLIKLRYNEASTSRPIKNKLLVLFVNNKTLLLGKDI